MSEKHVIILGGGVAGMCAAHELIERGFKVTVFEKQSKLPGGKARSIPVPKTCTDTTNALPGEHGFRFFPGFYQHMFDTLKRIPFTDEVTRTQNPNGVFDNLVECSEVLLARKDRDGIRTPTHFPRSLASLKKMIGNLKDIETGLQPGEGKVIVKKIWQLFTSCRQRRENEYEAIGWRQFTEAEKYSDDYNELFVDGLTGALVAGKASVANTRTNGEILKQMLLDFMSPFRISDRILNGPTNEAWLFPWLKYLKSKGVDYQFDCIVEELYCDNEKITGVLVSKCNEKDGYNLNEPFSEFVNSSGCDNEERLKTEFKADYYLCALPVERAAELVKKFEIQVLDPGLFNIILLKETVAWMNGIQFFLYKDVPINKGHIILPGTPWALTAISQAQFWEEGKLSTYSNGEVNGILSVIISNWTNEGILFGKPAEKCNWNEVVQEVWMQMKACLNRPGEENLKCENVAVVYIADSIIFPFSPHKNVNYLEPAKFGSKKLNKNDEPLLINVVNSWSMRNKTFTAIPNFFLASDYVRTNTNLATMESANEGARRAVNNIIFASGTKAKYCEVWKLKEPLLLGWYRWLDKRRYARGLPWKVHKPWFAGILKVISRLVGIRSFT